MDAASVREWFAAQESEGALEDDPGAQVEFAQVLLACSSSSSSSSSARAEDASRALALLENVVLLFPEHHGSSVKITAASAHICLGREGRARALLKEVAGSRRALVLRSVLARDEGAAQEALDLADALASRKRQKKQKTQKKEKHHKERHLIYLDAARQSLKHGDVVWAMKCLHKVINIDESLVDAWQELAGCLRWTGDSEAALSAADAAFQLAPLDHRARAMLAEWGGPLWARFFEREHQHIARLQACFRGQRVYRTAQARIHRERAAVVVQRCARGARTRGRLRDLARRCTELQRLLRGHLARNEALRVRRACLRLQCVARGMLGRRAAAKLRRTAAVEARARVHSACGVRVQSVVRGHLARRRLELRCLEEARSLRKVDLRWNTVRWRLGCASDHTARALGVRLRARAPPEGATWTFDAQAEAEGFEGADGLLCVDLDLGLDLDLDSDLDVDGGGLAPAVLNTTGLAELEVQGFQVRGRPAHAAAVCGFLDELWTRLQRCGMERLRHLTLQSSPGMTDAAFAGTLHLRCFNLLPLHTLNLNELHLGDHSCRALAHALQGSATLETLSLQSNDVTDKGCRWLAKIAALRTVSLQSNLVTAAGAATLRDALPRLFSLSV